MFSSSSSWIVTWSRQTPVSLCQVGSSRCVSWYFTVLSSGPPPQIPGPLVTQCNQHWQRQRHSWTKSSVIWDQRSVNHLQVNASLAHSESHEDWTAASDQTGAVWDTIHQLGFNILLFYQFVFFYNQQTLIKVNVIGCKHTDQEYKIKALNLQQHP